MSIKDPVLTKAEVVEACRKGDYDKIAFFLSGRKMKKQRTPLKFFRALTDQHWLLNYKDDKSQYTLLHHAAVEGQNGVSKLLMDYEPLLVYCKGDKDILPIHLAAWNGHLEIIKAMILLPQEKPLDLVNALNIFNETPLHLAVQRDHVQVIMYLLKKKSDPFIRNENRENVLDVAARLGKANAIHMLCQASPKFPIMSAYESLKVDVADIKRQFPTIYPLHLAAKNNHVECLRILREHGFVIDYTTEDGTALHVAAACGQGDAVRFLLNEGIDTKIKNQHGQTVLEMLIDLQENRRPEIAQFVKNRSGWRECRALLESTNNANTIRETNGRNSYSEKEAIWQKIPPQADVQAKSVNGKSRQIVECLPISTTLSATNQYDDHSPDTELSVRSDSGFSYNSQKARLWNSQMYDKTTGQPRFPITSPYHHGRHISYNRNSDTLPVKFTGIRTKPSPPRATILPETSFQTPEPAFKVPTLRRSDVMPYDNVPSNSQAYNQDSFASPVLYSPARMKRQDGYSTLPATHFKLTNVQCVRPLLTEDLFKFEKSTPSREQKLHNKAFTMSRTTCDREDSLGLTQSPRLDTRTCSVASSLSYACSTLENRNPTYDNGVAPLAQPEEIVGSVNGSVSGSVMYDSSDRDFANISAIFLGENGKSSESPPSPNTSRATIFETLWKKSDNSSGSTPSTLSDISTPQTSPSGNSNGSSSSQFKIPYLPKRKQGESTGKDRIRIRTQMAVPESSNNSGVFCDSRRRSICDSVPVVHAMTSQNGVSNSNLCASPKKTSGSFKFSQSQRQREAVNLANVFQAYPLSNAFEKKLNMYNESTSGQSSSKASSSTATSFTEDGKPDSASDDAEWEQVSSVFETFGAAPCRESVFVRDYAPRVAMYLQDRGSKALTLQMLDNALQGTEKDGAKSRHPNKLLTIAEWLEFDVCFSPQTSQQIGSIFIKYGFDKYTQLKGSLNVQMLDSMGIETSHQTMILNKVDQMDEVRPSANAFFYVSDWLACLELTDFLANFFNAGYKNMCVVKTSGLDSHKLKKLGVTLPGQASRILYSLKRANDEINWRDQPALTKEHATPPVSTRSSVVCSDCPSIDFVIVKNKLLTESVVYQAHQLGVHAITNFEDSDEAHSMMESIKKNLKGLDTIPRVALVLTSNGIRVMDEHMQVIRSNHNVYSVSVVCQDKKDLNFFSYIARNDENQFSCYTFCVLTSGIASEIISSIGIIFEIRSRIDSNRSLDGPLFTCPHRPR